MSRFTIRCPTCSRRLRAFMTRIEISVCEHDDGYWTGWSRIICRSSVITIPGRVWAVWNEVAELLDSPPPFSLSQIGQRDVATSPEQRQMASSIAGHDDV